MPLGVDDGTVGYTQPISHMEMVCFLGCQTTTVVYDTVWPQFATHVLTRCCDSPSLGGRCGRTGVGHMAHG